MRDRHDYVALEWVKGEIANTLAQARQALETFVENPQDSACMRLCQNYVHQVLGTLQMVEVFGSVRLADEMEHLTEALIDGRVPEQGEALEVLMQAILQLPVYLDRVQAARRDQPMAILPLLNDLRVARGEKLLSETSLFRPDISEWPGPLPAESLQLLDSDDLPILLRKLRRVLQVAQLGVIRNQNLSTNLDYMAKVFSRLEKLCQGSPLAPLWQIALALVEGLSDGSLSNSISVRTLLRQVDKELKRLLEQGIAAVNQPAPQELIKNLLFYVAKASPTSAHNSALRQRYGLDRALLDHEVTDSRQLGGLDHETMSSVLGALAEELGRVKDSFDLFVRSDRSKLAELESLCEPLKQIADTLAVLDFVELRETVIEQSDRVHELALGLQEPSDGQLMGVAEALLYVEASLAARIGQSENPALTEAHLATTDTKQIHQLVIKEARNDLEQAKAALNAFVSSQWQPEQLTDIPDMLNRVRGGLEMIAQPRAGEVINACKCYVQQLLELKTIADLSSLDKLAHALGCVDYYLECFDGASSDQDDSILDSAEQNLAFLGYATDSDSAVSPSLDPGAMAVEFSPEPVAIDEQLSFAAPTEALQDIEQDPGVTGVLLEPVQVDEHARELLIEQQEQQPLSIWDDAVAEISHLSEVEQAASVPELPSVLPQPPVNDEAVDEELREVFIEEAAEVQETIAEFLPRWLANAADREALGEVRRAFHTLKGSGRMVGALVIGELAWSIENLLNRVLDQSVRAGEQEHNLIGQAVGLLPELVTEFANQSQYQRDDVEWLMAQAHALASGKTFAAPEPALQAQPIVETIEQSTLSEPAEEEKLDGQLLDIFRNEAQTHLRVLDSFIDGCIGTGPYPITDDLLRASHTLKGSAYMAGLLPIAEVAGALEKLVREFKVNLQPLDMAGVEVLVEAQALINSGLEQLLSEPLRPIEGTEPFLEHAQRLHEQLQVDVEKQRIEEPALGGTDAQMLGIFLSEGLDILQNAEALLQRWRENPALCQEAGSLLDEMVTLGKGAEMAGIPQVSAFCDALQDLYQAVIDGSLLLDEPIFDEIDRAHVDLLNMMDQIAAGLQVSTPTARIEALRSLFEGTPEANGMPATQPVQADYLAGEIDAELKAIFLEEAAAILDSTGTALSHWLLAPEDCSPLSGLLRELHSLKGGANMAGIAAISNLTHELEELYQGVIEQRYPFSELLGNYLQQGQDALLQMLACLREQQPIASADELIASIQVFRLDAGEAQASTECLADEPPPGTDEPLLAADDEAPLEEVPVVAQYQDQELVAVFLEEGFDILDSANAALLRWQAKTENGFELKALQRDLHTLKGGARMAEIDAVGDLSHELEFLYEDLSNSRLQPEPELFSLLQACHDRLVEMLEAVRAEQAVPGSDELIGRIRQLRGHQPEPLKSAEAQQQTSENRAFEADILGIFLEETDELLAAMDASINLWQQEQDSASALGDLLPLLHMLKGSARLAEQSQLGDLSQQLEQQLLEAQAEGAPWPPDLLQNVQASFAVLQKNADELREQLRLYAQREPSVAPQVRAEVALIPAAEIEEQHQVLPFVRRAQLAAEEAARPAPQELVRVPAELLENLGNLAGETSIFRGRVEQQVSDFSFTLHEMESTIERMRDQLRRLDTETQAQILSRYQAEAERAGYEDFDPLEMDRHSQLQQLSRSLFESASDLLDLKETLASRHRDAETLLLQQARVNTELQEGLMHTRMVPFESLVPRLRRIVRQVSGELGKQVEFIVGNAEGEIDRTVMERIVPPLEHMLRNAIDHGIEAAAVRREAGKPEKGRIHLALAREGGDIILTLSDDGAGINREAVRRKAIERGLMEAEEELDDYDIFQFILEAGFSTAETVTQISGRGVGMDVVNAEVKQLGGVISIDSEVGHGTVFRIRLPFTVSVNRALMVVSGEDLYAVPLNTVEGIVRLSPAELEAHYATDAPSIEYLGQEYEVRYLGDLLNNGQHPKLVGQSLPLPLLLLRTSEYAVAVQVDNLAGSREIVVKSLGPQFAVVHGISGATILGDGRVVVILDLLATIRERRAHVRQLARPKPLIAPSLLTSPAIERPLIVMVVDDSVTVRKVTSRLLERNGMDVLTAKDGVDAITQLQEQKPDIMLLDIEMPRMDGYEVASLVRHDEALKDLPIIMITSRNSEKHRERAMSIGVNEYLIKPYQESQLLAAIEQWVKHI